MRRTVTHVKFQKDKMRMLGNPFEWWSPVSVATVVVDIEIGSHTYWASDGSGRSTRIVNQNGSLTALDAKGTDILPTLLRM